MANSLKKCINRKFFNPTFRPVIIFEIQKMISGYGTLERRLRKCANNSANIKRMYRQKIDY